MKENFDACLAATLEFEGGYSNDAGDRGGQTMWGIVHGEYDAWRRSQGQEPQSVREMTEAERDAIYRRRYWDVIRGDDLPAGLDFVVFDGGVNSGNSRGANWLNAALGLPLTGKIDPAAAAAALKSRDNAKVIDAAVSAREAFLRRIGHGVQAKFLRGWLSRCATVRKLATGMCTGQTPEAEARAGLSVGNSGAEVRELQTRLRVLGYPVGLIDGQYGPAVRRAVILFQDHEKLEDAPGEWQPAYWQTLDTARPIVSAERAAATIQTVAAGDPHANRLLIVQRILGFLGLSALGSGGVSNLPDTVSAFTSLRETWASVWQLADGHLWLLALIGTGAALVLVRVLIAEHLLSFQNGAVQGGAADGQS